MYKLITKRFFCTPDLRPNFLSALLLLFDKLISITKTLNGTRSKSTQSNSRTAQKSSKILKNKLINNENKKLYHPDFDSIPFEQL